MGNFRKSQRRLAYEKVVELIKRPPAMRRVKVVRSWDGDPNSARDWSTEQLPYVRLTAVPYAAALDETCTVHSPFLVQVEVVVAGLDQGDSMDLEEVLVRALWPEDRAEQDAVWAELAACGVSKVEMRKPFFGVPSSTEAVHEKTGPRGGGAQAFVARGEIYVDFRM